MAENASTGSAAVDDFPRSNAAGVPVRRKRIAPFVAIPVAVVMGLLVVLLANGNSATDRLSKSPLVGKPAPAIEGVTLSGDSFALSRLRGQWVVVNFFGSWCTPCIQEHPELVEFSDRHKGARDAAVVTIAFSDSPTNVRKFFQERGGSWPVLAQDTNGIAVAYGVIKVPETYLVAPSGLIVAKLIGGVTADQLDNLIRGFSQPEPTR